jgi:hypothetical protein
MILDSKQHSHATTIKMSPEKKYAEDNFVFSAIIPSLVWNAYF